MPIRSGLKQLGIGRRLLVYDENPEINERIRRAVRYGQTRWAEIWLSLIAVGVGLTLIGPTETFTNDSFRVIAAVIRETTAGCLCLCFGLVRLGALWVNGRRGRETSFIRTVGCVGGFVFWLAIAVGFALAAPPITTGVPVYAILALAELHASSHAASDMAAEDTFGFRKRRRKGGAVNAGSNLA